MGSTQHKINLEYTLVDTREDLIPEDQELLLAAEKATSLAYAPYSNFHVGAAARLSDGSISMGSNKENASFPAGICAERNLVNYVSDHFPGKSIVTIALAVKTESGLLEKPLAPCGICRQVLCETEKVQNSSIRMLLSGGGKALLIFDSCEQLLPFHFYVPALKK